MHRGDLGLETRSTEDGDEAAPPTAVATTPPSLSARPIPPPPEPRLGAPTSWLRRRRI
jgi:hypothetical protein